MGLNPRLASTAAKKSNGPTCIAPPRFLRRAPESESLGNETPTSTAPITTAIQVSQRLRRSQPRNRRPKSPLFKYRSLRSSRLRSSSPRRSKARRHRFSSTTSMTTAKRPINLPNNRPLTKLTPPIESPPASSRVVARAEATAAPA